MRTTAIGASYECRQCVIAGYLCPALRVSALRPAEAGGVLTMTANGWFQIGFYLLVIFLITKPIGIFMTRVFNREKTFLDSLLREKIIPCRRSRKIGWRLPPRRKSPAESSSFSWATR